MKSIKTKMLVLMISILASVCLLLSLVSYQISSNAAENDVKNALSRITAEAAMIVESRINGIHSQLNTVVTTNSIIDDPSASLEEKMSILKAEASASNFKNIGLADKSGKMVSTTGSTVDISGTDYFKKALSGENAISDPDIDESDNSIILIYAVPVKFNNQVVGVLTATKANGLMDIIKDITYGQNGKAYMLNKQGTTIAHTNEKLVRDKDNDFENVKKDRSLQPLVELERQMTDGKNGFGEYTYNGVSKYLGFAPVGNTGWSVAVAAPKSELMAHIKTMQTYIIIVSFVLLLLGVTITYFICGKITSGISSAIKHFKHIASGDLTVDIDSRLLKVKDEVGDLLRSIKTMQDSLKEMITAINVSSTEIDNQSENLSAIAEEMSASSQNVTQAIQEVAGGAGTQAESLAEVGSALNEFSNGMNYISASINEIDTNSRNISSMASESNEKMQDSIESINSVNNSFSQFVIKINDLGKDISRINEITEVINSIVNQTSLLSLNASIEAARAGEAGRGFAVVADEIRKLAEEAKNSSESISTLVKGISAEVNEMVSSADLMNDNLGGQISTIDDAIKSFRKIVNSVNEIIPKIENVNSQAMKINDDKSSIIQSIESVSAVSEEVSASSQEISASSEEMSASSQEVSSTSQMLSNMTKDVMNLINKFKLS